MELRARLIVEGFITGLHKSPYHGFSVEFAEHRPYNPGDELRHVDWKVFGKTDRYYLKQYEEETNLRNYVVLDTSSSMRYKHAAGLTKLSYGSYLAAALHFMMVKQRDATGLIAFDEDVHTLLRPKSTQAYLRQLQDNTPLALALLAKLSTRLHQRIDEIETLSLKNATHRVVRYLLTLAAHAPGENCRVEIPVAKQLVAGHLSIQPETFSRIMHRLGDEGIIRLDGREISILDRERLECFE